jgi:ribosomal protein L37AE/L43A
MQTFICPECGHKSFFDPWVESAHCPQCGYTPRPPGEQPEGFMDQYGESIPIAREELTRIYKTTKEMASTRGFIILVRRDDHLYTFGEDALRLIKILGPGVQVDEVFDGVPAPAARIPFERREGLMKSVEEAGQPIGMAQYAIMTCPRCGRQNLSLEIFFPSYRCTGCGYVPPERDQLIQALLRQGIKATEEGDFQKARNLLDQVLYHEGTPDQGAQALYWLAETTPNLHEKREYLTKGIGLEPTDPKLVAAIHSKLAQVEAILDGQITPSESLKDVPPEPLEAEPIHVVRHDCPHCGGRMVYSPEDGLLVCSSCQYQQVPGHHHEIVSEQSFTGAMAALKGHSHPVHTRSLECTACGATFMLAPATLSQACPYCRSDYSMEGETSQSLIPPTGLVPFEITRTAAQQCLVEWLKSKGVRPSKKIRPPLGIYLPIWTFDVMGLLSWMKPGLVFSRSETLSVFFDDILVPAVGMIPADLVKEKDDFDLGDLVPYDPDYLADWPAQTYDIALSDAALKARWRAIDLFRAKHGLGPSVQVRSSALRVESFKLILAPLWITHFEHQGTRYRVIIHGQNGAVRVHKLEIKP